MKVLSQRQREVIEWVARGKTNAEVGLILGIAECTVKRQVERIREKLGAGNKTHAVALYADYQRFSEQPPTA